MAADNDTKKTSAEREAEQQEIMRQWLAERQQPKDNKRN
jgi:hypothetical protein